MSPALLHVRDADDPLLARLRITHGQFDELAASLSNLLEGFEAPIIELEFNALRFTHGLVSSPFMVPEGHPSG
jgi:hypothetical protein